MDYTLHVVPAFPDLEYQPSPEITLRLLAELGALRWIDATAQSVRLVGVADGDARPASIARSRLPERLRTALGQGTWLMLEAPTVPQERQWPQGAILPDGRSRMYEFEKGSSFKPEFSESVALIWSPVLCARYGENVVPLLCPRCRARVTEDVERLGCVPLRSRCRSCNWDVQAGALVGETHDVVTGELRKEPSPVFRFALVLTAVHGALPAREPVVVDARLSDTLSRVTGVQWRALGSVR